MATTKNKVEKKVNGINPLNLEQEMMRMQVVELELKARYWKAQYDVRYYTLEAEKIQPEYNAYIDAERKKHEEMEEKAKENLKQIDEAAANNQVKIEDPVKTSN